MLCNYCHVKKQKIYENNIFSINRRKFFDRLQRLVYIFERHTLCADSLFPAVRARVCVCARACKIHTHNGTRIDTHLLGGCFLFIPFPSLFTREYSRPSSSFFFSFSLLDFVLSILFSSGIENSLGDGGAQGRIKRSRHPCRRSLFSPRTGQ